MKKLLLLAFILISSTFQSASAEKIPVKIASIEVISTHHDETEIGDWINFEIVNDVYTDDKLYLKKGTQISGFVDFYHPNGWAGDSAEVKFKKFETTDENNKKITINYPINVNGCRLKSNGMKQYLFWTIVSVIRGSEIYIEPDTKTFNIFLTQ
jgi:hypothetical protein